MENSLQQPSWSSLEKIAFRFSFFGLGLFILFVNNGAYPFFGYVMEYPDKLMQIFIPWVGKHILHLSYDITVFTNGSGDTTYDYVILFTIFCVSVTGTILWTLLDRNRKNYSTLYYWLTVAVRFYVGLMLFSYGMIKVIKLQFPSPTIARLLQPYGNSSPMGLAWTFLGFSKGYNMFMGFAEVAAILLLFRRTVTAGAIITLMTTSNVMAVNYFYDVPVKIVSTALVMLTVFLLLPDIKRLFKFFFTGEAIALPVRQQPVFKRKWVKITGYAFKYILLAYVLVYGTILTIQSSSVYGEHAPRPPLSGLYNVKTFVVNNDTLPPLITDSTYWRYLGVSNRPGFAGIKFLNDTLRTYTISVDTVLQTIYLKQALDTNNKCYLKYQILEDRKFLLTGTIKKDSVSILCDIRSAKDFRLMKRGFHWINEYPYNR